MANWTKIRNEYINGHISYRKLAEKHDVSFHTLKGIATEEKWFDKRKEQWEKIRTRTEQKTVEKIAEEESDLAANIHKAANELLEKLNVAIAQTDLFIEKTKIKTPTQIRDKQGNVHNAFMEQERIELSQKGGINVESVKQIASALRELQAIQTTSRNTGAAESPNINIRISAATVDDVEKDE